MREYVSTASRIEVKRSAFWSLSFFWTLVMCTTLERLDLGILVVGENLAGDGKEESAFRFLKVSGSGGALEECTKWSVSKARECAAEFVGAEKIMSASHFSLSIVSSESYDFGYAWHLYRSRTMAFVREDSKMSVMTER